MFNLQNPAGNNVAKVLCPVEGCGGVAVPCYKDGRFYVHRGNVFINVPKTFMIPKCDRCGTDLFPEGSGLDTALVQVLEAEYQLHADMIRGIVQQHEVKSK
jgi:hypothetical protein